MSKYGSLLNSIDQINDHLFISGYGPVTKPKLKELGITCVIDATNVPKNKLIEDIDYLKVAVDDSDWARLNLHFDQAADKIQDHRLKGGKTLVHCAAGISRSATLCIVFLIKHHTMTLRESYFHVKEKRKMISPNTGFWRQMIDYERSLRGENSVKMIRGAYREMPDVYFPSDLGLKNLKL